MLPMLVLTLGGQHEIDHSASEATSVQRSVFVCVKSEGTSQVSIASLFQKLIAPIRAIGDMKV